LEDRDHFESADGEFVRFLVVSGEITLRVVGDLEGVERTAGSRRFAGGVG
jgi:hypothetical protein